MEPVPQSALEVFASKPYLNHHIIEYPKGYILGYIPGYILGYILGFILGFICGTF